MSTASNQEIPVTIRTIDIKFTDFSVMQKLPGIYSKKELEKENVQFEFNAAINIENTTRHLHIDLIINFFADPDKVHKLGFISSSGDFEVINLEDLLEHHANKMPLMLLSNIAGVLISTTRGFLILKSEGTVMEGIIVPIIDPSRLFIPPVPTDQVK